MVGTHVTPTVFFDVSFFLRGVFIQPLLEVDVWS